LLKTFETYIKYIINTAKLDCPTKSQYLHFKIENDNIAILLGFQVYIGDSTVSRFLALIGLLIGH